MMRITSLAAALSLSLATAATATNPFTVQLNKLNESQRTQMFQRYMTTAKRPCAKVTRLYFQGAMDATTDLWNVQCDGKTDWSIRLKGNGKTEFYSCSSMTKSQQCWSPVAVVSKRK